MKAAVTGWGKYTPENVMTNEELSKFVDTSDEWIVQRTGVKERRVCHVNNSDMASVAGLRAVASAGLDTKDIDCIILATCTPDTIVPSAASFVQQKMGCTNALVYDMNAACAGFMYALEQAKAFVESGIYKNVVIIGSEHITWLLDWSDRATAVLFGDAAGSFVISATEDGEAGELLSFHNGLSSDKLDILRIPNFGSAMNRFTENAAANITWNFDGAEIFKSGIRAMGKASEEAIKKSGLQKEDIDLLIPHQANLRIVEGLERKLKLPNAKVVKKIHKYANTSAASVPLAFVDAIEEGEIKGGETMLVTAVGAGLAWGAGVIKLGKRTESINTSKADIPKFNGSATDILRESIDYFLPENSL